MEVQTKQLQSIWGKWWESFRKWFYPAWLIYETSVRFYEYSIDTHLYLSEISSEILAFVTAIIVFIICSAFLTIPATFILYKFFKVENLTGTSFENNIKKYF